MSLPGCQGRIDDTDAQPKRYFSDRARAQRSRNLCRSRAFTGPSSHGSGRLFEAACVSSGRSRRTRGEAHPACASFAPRPPGLSLTR